MAPDTPLGEPEMQDTPPCQYPTFCRKRLSTVPVLFCMTIGSLLKYNMVIVKKPFGFCGVTSLVPPRFFIP